MKAQTVHMTDKMLRDAVTALLDFEPEVDPAGIGVAAEDGVVTLSGSVLDLPIVPVAIDGTCRVWPRDSWRIRPARVGISFGEPFTPRSAIPTGMSGEAAYEAVTDELKRRIQRMLDNRSE